MALLGFLPEIFQGIVIMASGIILLLHTLGFMEQGLRYMIIAGAIYMIVLGFIRMGGMDQLRRLTEKKNSTQKEK